jgi:hypothetical protein
MEEKNQENITKRVELLSRMLSFGERPDIDNKDEFGVALFSNSYQIKRFQCIFNSSRWTARDKRKYTEYVAFTPLDHRSMKLFFEDDLWNFAVTAPRRSIIDVQESFAKIVAVVFVMCGDEVLLAPRENKKILPDVFTLSVMESLVVDDFYDAFSDAIFANQVFGESPRSVSYVDPVNHSWVKEQYVSSRAILEECPELKDSVPTFTGMVGGGKDVGMVWGVNVKRNTFKAIKSRMGGVTFNINNDDYDAVATYYGGYIDGWSQSILKYVQERG